MSLSIAEIENNLNPIFETLDQKNFIYKFIQAFGTPKATIARLRSNKANLSIFDNELSWKKKMFFKVVDSEELEVVFANATKSTTVSKIQPRFIIVTDFKKWLSLDVITEDILDCTFTELQKNFDFYLPLAGIEKAQYLDENPADVKAAEKMAKLYDQINNDNEFDTEEKIHHLNVFLSRLLFCFFAEDTGIFTERIFTNAVKSNTKDDGTDTQEFLRDLFQILNIPQEARPNARVYLHKFPYVNGGLFREQYPIPEISYKARKLIIECGDLDWSEINPDIFGSMIQAVVTTEKRGGQGMHYTSVPNIMKVINPLFLDELKEEFEKAKGNEKSLNALLERISKIKIFDPACGSGNFLIIAYKELRLLENDIFTQLASLKGKRGSGTLDLGTEFSSLITLTNFYGIELDDFAHEIARLSLWLAEHQMNQIFFKSFGFVKPALPLKDSSNIVHGNACHLDWEVVCPKEKDDEIYILGNPPYYGYSKQTEAQKRDVEYIFTGNENCNQLDYISCWFYNGSKYISGTNISLAFVSTNSINQGIQVNILWPLILQHTIINFAYTSFKWENQAKGKANVYVVIIGLKSKEYNSKKVIFDNYHKVLVDNINGYLVNFKDLYIQSSNTNISKLPKMVSGVKAGDDGNLLLDIDEKNDLFMLYPGIDKYIKQYLSNKEFMNKIKRYCIWVNGEDYSDAVKYPPLRQRFEKLREFRLASKKLATKNKAEKPYAFDETNAQFISGIFVPQTGSEKRKYLPIGYFEEDTVVGNSGRVIYGSPFYIFSILSSLIHMVWVRAVAGRLKMDMQYSNTLCYNTFPFPKITKTKEKELEDSAYKILEIRERYPEKTLAQLYDPDKMPEDLKQAHHENDLLVESCYRDKPFTKDEETLEYLFKLYEKMTTKQTNKS